MDSDEEPPSGSRTATVPFQDWQRILGGRHPPVPEETATASASLSREVDDRNVVLSLSGRGDEEVEYGVVDREVHETSAVTTDMPLASSPSDPRGRKSGTRLCERSNNKVSIQNVLSSDPSSASEGSLEPALTIGLNSRTINDDKTVPIASSGMGQQWGSMQSSSASSVTNKMDREVIVTGTEAGERSTVFPTPLGRARRASLFERANSTNILPGTLLDGSQRQHSDELEDASCDRSRASGSNASMKRVDAASGDNGDMGVASGALSPGGGRYNTVLRDWLMHVLEKDDQHNTQEVQNVWAAARHRRRLAHKTFEAADYELYDSKVWHTHKREAVSKTHRGTRDLKGQREEVERWLTLGLGVAVGLSGCFVTYFTELVFHEKLHLIAHVFEHNEGQSDMKRYGTAFGWLWFINSTLSAAAFGLVWYKPWSNGSGIPETKCVLNGVSIPQVLAPSTLVCKLIGVIFGVASGLPIGKEGPMIHAGAAIGGSIASLPRVKYLAEFRNDRDRRDLAAMGTAAGVAAAFRTPIGGVLFAIEEGASFWTTVLTWRSFAAAVITVAVYYLVFNGKNMFKQPLEAADIFVFGEFQESDSSFYMWELTVFAFIATLGGLLGAAFIAFNKRLALLRAKYVSGPRRRFVEIMTVSTVMTTMSFFLPLAIGECRAVPTDLEGWSPAGVESLHRLVTLNCHHGYYNELGTLFLNEADGVIKLLFHFGTPGLRTSTVLLYSGIILFMECVTSGMWVCSGLFIPSILAGASLGRGCGEFLGRNSRAYALVGAAGVLGGISRMALSVTVMMVEASGWVLFVIPLMLVFITARAVGNHFNQGIYDTQISIKKMPFLEQEPPEETRTQNMRANQLMSKEVVCLRPIETVDAVMSVLRDYDHNCFPVVEDRDQRVLLGTVHRKNLSVLLQQRHFSVASVQDPTRPDDSLPTLSWDTLEKSYPDYPKFRELNIGKEDMDCLMDIAAYVQIGPHSINEHASAHRAYIMFRTLGLRHLVVVNHYNEVMGMITRENLLPEHFEHGGAYHTRRLSKFSAA